MSIVMLESKLKSDNIVKKGEYDVKINFSKTWSINLE
jgi:hypothetical protein